MVTLEVRSGVIEEIADVGRLTLLHRQSEELSEDTHWCKWGRSLQRKGKCPSILAEVTVAEFFTGKELLEIYHNTERAKGKMLESNPNLVMNLTICHDREKMFAPYLNYTMRRQALFKLLLICLYILKNFFFFTKKANTLILSVSNYNALNKYWFHCFSFPYIFLTLNKRVLNILTNVLNPWKNGHSPSWLLRSLWAVSSDMVIFFFNAELCTLKTACT